MASDRILALADDLTGALEVGGKFAASGVSTFVQAGPCPVSRSLPDSQWVLVVDTETRHAEPLEAARCVGALARGARTAGFNRIYKKTDSTLRGNIGAELAALVEVCGGSLLYVPAYPRMGRTVRTGSLYIDNVLVGATGFAGDALNPVRESHIPTLFAHTQCRFPVRSVKLTDIGRLATGCIAICDGETDAEVQAATQAFVNSPTLKLAAGPAAFAAHLARLIDAPRCQTPALPRVRTALVVNGSLNEVSMRQVDRAKRDGFPIADIDLHSVPPPSGAWLILEHPSSEGTATPEYAKGLAKTACQLLARCQFDALVVFGGDTAYAMLVRLGHPPLHPLGELMEGIPIARIEVKRLDPSIGARNRDLYFVTKAGGFGSAEVLSSLRELLSA